MADEIIGGVKVTVGADYAPMVADFAQAQTVAAKSGQKIASAFASGTGLVDQFGRSLQNVAAAANGTTPAVATLDDVVAHLAASEELLAESVGLASQRIRAQSSAVHEGVTEIQATSGALRTLEGSGGIRAAERFLTMVPGVGAALQTAFPLIGILALGEALVRTVGKFGELSEAEKHLAEVTKQTEAEIDKLGDKLESINVSRLTEQFGQLAGMKLKGFYDESSAKRDQAELDSTRKKIEDAQRVFNETKSLYTNNPLEEINIFSPRSGLNPVTLGARVGEYFSSGSQGDQLAKIKELQQQAQVLQEKLKVFNDQKGKDDEDITRKGAQDSGRLNAARISAEEAQNTRLVEMAKLTADQDIAATHRSVAAGVAAMHDREAAAVATAEEEVRVAKDTADRIEAISRAARDRSIVTIRQKAGAESAGKTPTEAADIQVKAQGEIAAARDAYDKQQLESAGKVAEAEGKLADAQAQRARKTAEVQASEWEKSYDAITKAAKETSDAQGRAVEKQIETQARIDEIQERGAGNVRSIGAGAQKVQLEAQYGAQVSHTRQQEIDYLTRIAALENQINSAKLIGLAEAQQEAAAAGDQVKAAELQVQLNEEAARLHAQAANSQAQTAATLQRQSLGSQLGATAQQGVGQLSNALAKGIVDGGKGLGKDIRQSLAGIGKEMLGDILSKSMAQLVIAITGNTIATNINTLWTEIQALASHIPFFAGGTDSAPGGFAMVGEKGPEIVNLPRGSQVVPNHAIKRYADGVGFSASSSSNSQSFGDMHFHAHGVQNPDHFIDHVMRKLPDKLKARSSGFSPYSK